MIEFAELEDYQDLKLKNYSSGMHVRLAFSVAIQVDADDPADRRGARRRRRRLPAEVLRRLQRDARRGPDDPVRHPRHGRGEALLPPRAAARARRGSSRSASRRTSANRYLELNFEPRQAARSTRPRATPSSAPATMTRGSSRRGSRTSRARRVDTLVQGEPYTFQVRVEFVQRRRRTRRSRWSSTTTSGTRCSSPPRRSRASARGASSAGERAVVLGDVRLRVRARPLPAVGDRRAPRRRGPT